MAFSILIAYHNMEYVTHYASNQEITNLLSNMRIAAHPAERDLKMDGCV
jgi:hypothetical protein